MVAVSSVTDFDFHAFIYPNNSASSQSTFITSSELQFGTGAQKSHSEESTSAVNLANAFSIGLNIQAVNGGGVMTLNNYTIKVTP